MQCFRSLKDPSRPVPVHYFSNSKSWMNSDIMETLDRLDHRMNFENCKVILFLDNARCHPESLQRRLTNIKLVFFPKNTTSLLQLLGAGTIRNFNFKYRKPVLCFVVSHVSCTSNN